MNHSERQDIKEEQQIELLSFEKNQIFNKTTKINKRDLSPNRIIRPGFNKKENNANTFKNCTNVKCYNFGCDWCFLIKIGYMSYILYIGRKFLLSKFHVRISGHERLNDLSTKM